MRNAAFLLTTLFSTSALAAGAADCGKLWARVGPVKEVSAPLLRIPQVPDQGAIDGFSTKSLYVKSDRRFIPSTLSESNCALDRMLDARVREAIRAGGIDYVAATKAGTADEGIESLSEHIDAQLNELFVPRGMATDTGLSGVKIQIESAFDIRRWSSKSVSPLQKLAFESRVYSPNLILNWLLISYVEHLDVSGFDSGELIKELRELDASKAPPPPGLQVSGCSERLTYRWPTVSLPISTYDDVDEYDVVHWAVCGPSHEVWVYHYLNGWKKAQASEQAQVCKEQGAEEPFRSFCTH